MQQQTRTTQKRSGKPALGKQRYDSFDSLHLKMAKGEVEAEAEGQAPGEEEAQDEAEEEGAEAEEEGEALALPDRRAGDLHVFQGDPTDELDRRLVAQDLLTSVAKSCAEHTLLVLEHLTYRTGVGCAKTCEGFGGTWIERLSLTNKW